MLFLNPKKVIENLEIEKKDTVVDFGAGIGRYTIPLVKKTSEGKVYAVEINPDMIDRLRNELSEARVAGSVEIIRADVERNIVQIPQDSVDWIIAANIFFAIEKKDDTINVIKNLLKPDGKVLVIDWEESFSGMGPSPEHVFSEHDAKEIFTKHGFHLIKRIPSGSHHYGLIFSRIKDVFKKNEKDEDEIEEIIIEDIEE